jgi:hypothetical protein
MPELDIEKPKTRFRSRKTNLAGNYVDEPEEEFGGGLAGVGDALDAMSDEGIPEVDDDLEDEENIEAAPVEDVDDEEEIVGEDEEEEAPDLDLAAAEPEPEEEAPIVRRRRLTRTDDVEEAAPPRKRRTPGRPSALKNVNERVREDFSDLLEGLEFGVDAHKISVFRLEPEYDPESGKKIGGLQATFSRPIELEDIQKQFGGGTYRVTIRGPREGGRGSEIKTHRMVEISGAPIPLPDPREEARKRRAEEEKEKHLVDTLLQREERARHEARKENMELRKELQSQQNNVLQLVSKMNEGKPDPMAAFAPVLQAMREDSARRDAEAKAERERQEQLRREEREEQRRRDEEARRQHDLEMQRQQRQFELQMKQLEMQQQMQLARAKEESQAQMQSMQMMMQFLSKTEGEKERASRESTQMQMEMMRNMSDVQRQSMESQLKLIMAQLNDAKNKDDFFEGIQKFQALQQMLNPQEEDNRETWEKVLDRVGEAVPAVFAGMSSLGAGAQQPTPGPRPVLPPGTVAVVEDFESLPEPQPQLPEQPPAVTEADVQARANSKTPEEAAMNVNPLKDFPAQYEGVTNEDVLTELVYRLDLAVQRDLDLDAMYDKCIKPLPESQKMFLKVLPVDTMIGFIEENVPGDWALRTIGGEQSVRDCHAKLARGE